MSDEQQVILLADDEPIMLDTFSGSFEAMGYTVLQAINGKIAIDLIGQHSKIDFLITDENMPQAKGSMVALEYFKKFPNGQVCIISGHLDLSDNLPEGLKERKITILQKPFASKTLREWVKKGGNQ